MLLPLHQAFPIGSGHAQMNAYLLIYSSCPSGIHGNIPSDAEEYLIFYIRYKGQVRKLRHISLPHESYSRKIFRSFLLFGHFISAFFCETEYPPSKFSVFFVKTISDGGGRDIAAPGFTSTSPSQCPFECYILTSTVYLCFHLADMLLKKKVCFNKQKFYFSE